MGDTLWSVLGTVRTIAGQAGSVRQALPGLAPVRAGIVLPASVDGACRFGGGALAVMTVLPMLAWVRECVARRYGAKRIGAAIGTVAGFFLGFVGVRLRPLVGAAAGECRAQRNDRRAIRSACPPGSGGWPACLPRSCSPR